MQLLSLEKTRWRIHEILEVGSARDTASIVVDSFLVFLIVVNIVAFAAGTVPQVHEEYGTALEVLDAVSVLIFTVEYVMRLWVCVDLPTLRHLPPALARLKFASRPLLVIDFFAIAPFYLGSLVGLDLRILRVLRLLRFFKLARYSPALQTLISVVRLEIRALFAALIIMLSLLLFAATAMHFIEGHVQPNAFGSIPSAMWWAVATLTTVGYGDVTPVTALGKFVGGLVMIFGLGMFALPIGILSTGFAQELGRRQFVVAWNMVAKVPMFTALGAAELSRIVRLLKPERVPADSIVMRPGDPPDGMYFIVSGTVRVETEGKIATLGEGDHFGEVALFEGRNRTATVTAITDAHLLELEARDFEYLQRTDPRIGREIARVAEAHVEEVSEGESPG